MSIDSDDNVYAVEDIVDMKKTKDGKELYLIKWLNYGVAHNSWEPGNKQSLKRNYLRVTQLTLFITHFIIP